MKAHTLSSYICGTLIILFALQANAQQTPSIKINENPYLQSLTDSTVSIVWTTDKPAIAWVEIAPDDGSSFYQRERQKFFHTEHGFNLIGTLHRVDLKGLKPGVSYRYRVYSKEVLQQEGTRVQYGATVAANVYSKAAPSFRTASAKDTLRFFVVNDIHGNNELLRDLTNQHDLSKTDFAILNGDMLDQFLSEKQMFDGFLRTTTELLGGKIPFYFARGNHETRGSFAFSYPEFFPTPTNKLYYTFSYGDVFFIVLDSGEDKPDTDIEYSELANMDNYRSEQAKWLETVVASEGYKNAKYKIAICHIPPMGNPDDWHGLIEVEKKFVPILNKAKVQIMLSAHLHRHFVRKPDQMHHFPILVNANTNTIQATVDKKQAVFKVIDRSGKEIERIVIPSDTPEMH